jgi:hypothetical protein
MTFATFLTAAIGYALIYAAMPNRATLRDRSRAKTRRLLVTGAAVLVVSVLLGAEAFGPVLGPIVALVAAVTAGSVLVLTGPLVVGEAGSFDSLSRRKPSGEEEEVASS